MAIRTRKPTGAVPWPLILLEGGEKAGKSWACAELSASERVGQTYWIDLGEGAADEYGAIPGARYLVVEHDGTWASILGQVVEIRAEAARAKEAGEPPVVLVIDSMTAEWDLLKDWATNRAKGSNSNKARLQRDPNAEINISMNYWNDANTRHRRLMTILMTFPGIVVMTARGKDVAALDASGKPIEGSKDYKVEGHKNLAYDASVWVRLSREQPPIVVGARSVHAGIKPGVDKPQPMHDFTLERLIFDALKCDPAAAHVRDMTEVKAGSESPDLDNLSDAAKRLLSEAEDAANIEALRLVWGAINPLLKSGEITPAEAEFVNQRIQQLSQQLATEPNGEAA
ncbi:AAA family ATPase [Nonomuraea sp. NPDC003804]|uniref:AAA family ATPase n=1 Tax=Nonomuraea sp. NPDC003804 TaxID=3154547 RepID=UPI0033B5337C